MRIPAAAAVMALALLAFCALPVMAHPTRPESRPAATRLAPAHTSQLVARNSRHARIAQKSESARTTRANASSRHTTTKAAATKAAAPARRRHATSADFLAALPHSRATRASRSKLHPAADRTSSRGRRASSKENLAARSAILAADSSAHLRAPGTRDIDQPSPRLPADLPPLKSIEEEAATPVILPSLRVASLYDSHGRLIVPRPLRGSHEILVHQNEMAERDGIDRIRDDGDVLDLRRTRQLVALPENETLHVDDRLPENRRYSRPWTAAFLAVLGRDYYASFHTPLQIDSAVRTIAVQQRLMRTNGNAAAITGDSASPHLTGQAIDIGKGGLSITQIAWMRAYLQPFINQGKIDVEEEFKQACFHISVYKSYVTAPPSKAAVAEAR